MVELIFMLTHHDVTIPNALEVFEEVKHSGLKFVGCKDIGLPITKLQELFGRMKNAGMITFLEVVSSDEAKHFMGVEKAICVRADYLIGSMPQFARKTLEYLKEKRSKLKFFPYIGKVVGHPCLLRGTREEITKDARIMKNLGADGINLLAYRYDGDIEHLIKSIQEEVNIPLIIAGNINSFDRVRKMTELEIWAFTIGSAILDKKFVLDGNLIDQIRAVLKDKEKNY